MKTVYSEKHRGHAGQSELNEGAVVPGFERPERADFVLARVRSERLGDVVAPKAHDLATARKVHRPDYLDFLPTVWDRWTAEGRSGAALPFCWPTRGLRADRRPDCIDGLLGYYSFDAGAGIVAGSWEAIKASHDTALTGADLLQAGERAAFALCRPPGHHAGSGFMGGYCYINNAAVAAQRLLDQGAARISVLDIDYHHGNGTQEIFYARADVQVINIHADPMQEYPYFLGHSDETGADDGAGFNFNYPLPFGTGYEAWAEALDDGCEKLKGYRPDAIIVSLGVDTFEKDPISRFKLQSRHYPLIGARIAALQLPTLFVMEGGYAVEEIGVNAVGVLTGFKGA